MCKIAFICKLLFLNNILCVYIYIDGKMKTCKLSRVRLLSSEETLTTTTTKEKTRESDVLSKEALNLLHHLV